MTLEHMVDAVLYLEGDAQKQFRILRSVKNRFGSTQEIGIFEMREEGFVEVEDASRAFLDEHAVHSPGVCVTASMEGTRPLLLEVQALVAGTSYGVPQRRVSGIDPNRLALLLAILEKRQGLALAAQDVFLNITGGIKVVEPAVDLAAALSIVSSFREVPVPRDTVVFGEVGLSGEVRAVSQIRPRVQEASRLGFKRVVVPQGNLKGLSLDPDHPVDVLGVKTLSEALDRILPR
jgi:DNA repair protein RadA/Sms